jgi:hypothetical protein
VNELKVKTPKELSKLKHIIDLISDDYLINKNKFLLKLRCDAILNLIKNISKELKYEIENMSYHPNRILNYHSNELTNHTKESFKIKK